MKVWVYEDQCGELTLSDISHGTFWKNRDFIGTLDLDVQPEKKWVTKKIISPTIMCDAENMVRYIEEKIPFGTKNVTVTYEVEE